MKHVPKSPAFGIPGRKPVVEVMDDSIAAILRTKTPAERLDMAGEMWEFARDLQIDVVRQQHPDWPAEQVQLEVARRMAARSE